MLTLQLSALAVARGRAAASPVLIKAGISRDVANRLLSGSTRSIHFDHIETICRVFYYTPNDIFCYAPGKDDTLEAGHPLYSLAAIEYEALTRELATLPPEKLRAVTQLLREV